MKKINKKKIIILIILIFMLIIQIKAFRDSNANKIIDITAKIMDVTGFLSDENFTLQAINEKESGMAVTLPSIVNEKKIKKYIIKEKQINEQDTNIIQINETEKLPGETLYLTKEEVANEQIELKVEYETKEINQQLLYNKKLEKEIENNKVIASGFMPLESQVVIEKSNEQEISTQISEYINENSKLKVAYDIKILLQENKYQPSEFKENIKITISGIETSKQENYKVIHINDYNKIEELKDVEIQENSIKFNASEFSTYAIISENILNNETIQSEENTNISDVSEINNGEVGFFSIMNTQNTWDGTKIAQSFSWGNGTKQEPYLIADGEELAYLAEQVNNGTSFEGQYFQLASDIDLGNNRWTPIGTTNNSFRGIFDGAGHTITNAKIIISNLPDRTYESYGIFGSIGGGTSKSIIKNLELNAIKIDITANGSTATQSGWTQTQYEEGIRIGCLTGTLYKNANIENVIISNSTISDSNIIDIYNYQFQFAVGGIVGYITNNSTSDTDPGVENRYVINNCYAKVEIALDATASVSTSWIFSRDGRGQYHTGGIVGTIRSQPVWPTNCLYDGTIKSNGYIGPMFGGLINNSDYSGMNQSIWNGNDAGNLTTNNAYYTNYYASGTKFTQSVTSGDSTARISNSSSNVGYVQGVNKGSYTTDMGTMLNMFNNNVTSNNEYVNWIYENNIFTFKERLTTTKTEPQKFTYEIIIDDPYQIGNYTTRWYKNGTEDTSIKGTTYVWTPNYNLDENMVVVTFDGKYYAISKFTIKKISVDIVFDINKTNNSVTASLTGEGLKYTSVKDYSFQWYKYDISGDGGIIEGETSLYLGELEECMDYKLVGTNNKIPQLSTQNTFTYGDRTVIFVDYNNGNNNRDGYTPETAIQTLPTAYERLPVQGNVNSNVIVIVGDYNARDVFYNTKDSNNANYQKNVTITGKYAGINYYGTLDMYYSSSRYNFINGDTNFQYLTFDGNGSQAYLYAQGHNLTMGKGLYMKNYASANTNQGLITGSSPAFHVLGGYLQYNRTTLPRNNGKILIKSGAYGRILGGGGSGDASGAGQTTSKDFTGSNLINDIYTSTICIDIKDSTKENYTYDINLLVGGATAGNMYANITIDVKNGSVGRLLGGSIGDKTYIRNWNYPENTFIGYTTINLTGGTIQELYGGSLGRNMDALAGYGNASDLICDIYHYGTITINISGNVVINSNIYGAGAGGVTGYNENSSDPYKSYGKDTETTVNVNITGGTINGNIYGGGYGYTEYLTENVTADDGGALYGNTNIIIDGVPIIKGNIYAAGCGYNFGNKPNLAQMNGISNIEIKGTPTIEGQIFGAGQGISGFQEMAKLIGDSNIKISTDLTTEVYGGGNISKTQGTTNLNIEDGTHISDIYGGGNLGIVEGTTNINIQGGKSTNIFGGGNQEEITTSNINVTGGIVENIYGGGNRAGARTTNIKTTGGSIKTMFGGSNVSGDIGESFIETKNQFVENNINVIYGGNNLGGTVQTTNLIIDGQGVKNVYGGGNQAVTNATNVNVNGEVIQNVYGGGNQAGVNTNTNINIIGATIGNNVYGGGNEGTVTQNTYVHVQDSIVKNSVYAGGNGSSATVFGNTNVTLDGTTNQITNSVFGGGNKAETGTTENNNSKSTVNIVGGNIGKNVYGGANTSVVYGETQTNIGYNAVNDTNLKIGDIKINGTVFGGGEANESGSEIYDFDFISVTVGIDIQIDGKNHDNFSILGSIFGSGNASSTSGTSYITIKNYGTPDKPQSNISLQRTNCATIINSAISLSGTTDRTNEYSGVFYSISRVNQVKLKNNSVLYLCNGANLLTELDSLVDENGQEVKGTVSINEDTGEITKNVDNRIYMIEGKNLNIALNEKATLYGQVHGMFFLGLFTNKNNPSTSTGFYHSGYNNGDKIINEGTFVSNSYVMAEHMVNPEHNIKVDGFYTNYNVEGNIKVDYIKPTPESDIYYMWLVGKEMEVKTFNIEMVASKYATLGTYELALAGFADPNIKFSIAGFSSGLLNNITLVDPSEIQSVELDEEKANTQFGLTMKTGHIGWQTKGQSEFLTKNGGSYTGTSNYNSDNSTYTPILDFCFYHSQNLTKKQALGDVKIRLQVLTPIDDLNYKLSYIDINIVLSTALFQDDFYEAGITPGQEFDIFTTSDTTITNHSAFSTYYSLLLQDFTSKKYSNEFQNYKRVLVSRNSNNEPYAFPQDTKITMLDMATKQYYYYVVTAEDVQNKKYIYSLADFCTMGSNDAKFNESEMFSRYYNVEKNLLYENFIFHVNFADSNMNENVIDNSLLMELRNKENQTIIGVLGIQRENMVYTVFPQKDATIKVAGNLEPQTAYLGEKIKLNVTTTFTQEVLGTKTIYDTQYFDKKLGLKISIYDSNGNRLNNDSLLGINYELNGQIYYPRIDGTARICVADKITDVLAKIKINTENNKTLATGDYKVRIESFGSSDGIYYGLIASDMIELDIRIINSSYGLKVITPDNTKIVNKGTGETVNGNNSIVTTLEYSSSLSNPNIAVSLYRRDYTEEFSQNYNIVDLKDYVTTQLVPTKRNMEYVVSTNPVPTSTQFFSLKQNLVTGTYKLVYKLYDGDAYVGEAYEYIIIK